MRVNNWSFKIPDIFLSFIAAGFPVLFFQKSMLWGQKKFYIGFLVPAFDAHIANEKTTSSGSNK
jgi:hypothetical protein